MKGRRILLNFGAVDWDAMVWVNGKPVGDHKGGYTPFQLDITEAVKDGQNEVFLSVYDDTATGLQATGKQSHKKESYGCVYTRTTGIWQTVWLEAVGQTYLRGLALYPDLDTGRVFFNAELDGPTDGIEVRLTATADDELIGEEAVGAAWRSTLGVIELSDITPWHPGKPFLYDLLIEIERNGEPVDSVRSYFGLRKLALEGSRFLINGQPVFQRLVLDQGFYPDGIYTAPSEEALRKDIELAMAAGFNGARLHQKVFEPRFLYWADRLGYIVWGEYADWGLNRESHEALAHALHEWRTVLHRDRNHPAIVGWCPLNETRKDECHASAQRLLAVTQTLDPTRPFLDTSGYVHLYPETDIYDCHDYCQKPEDFAQRFADPALTSKTPWSNNQEDPRSAYRGQPYFVSEYGGIRIDTGRDVGEGWGYGGETVPLDAFFARYKALTDVLLNNPHLFGFCYTQLADIEQEQNGIVFYDRQPKYDLARLKAINARPAAYER
jgi:beta-galactosidase/beta-glucuronidase